MLSVVAALLLALAGSSEPETVCKPAEPCILEVGFRGEIGEDVADFVDLAIKTAVEHGVKDVIFRISSPGGDALSTRRAFAAIHTSPVPIHCWVDAMAASASAWLLQACQERVLAPGAFIMIHRPRLNAEGLGLLTESDLFEGMKALRTFRHEMFSDIARRMRLAEAEIDAFTADEQDWFLRGEAAVASGAADRVSTLEELRESLGTVSQ